MFVWNDTPASADAQAAVAFGEHRALEAVAIDAFLAIDERRLLDADAHPRLLPRARPVVEAELRVAVLEPEHVRLPLSVLPVPVSRVMSGVMRKLTMCEMLPVTLM